MQFTTPVHPSETDLYQRFAKINVGAGKHIDIASLSPEMKNALLSGMKDGQQAIDQHRKELGGKTDGLFGSREFLKNDFLSRATGAQMGIGGNSKEEALYSIYEKDAGGQLLDGSKHQYTLRFAPNQMPPVNAFWSLTMYNLPDQLLVRNPLNRYLINSPMLPDLKRDADGGLTIYIQNTSPGKDKEANWLPAPKAPFMLTMRYYLPKPELIDGTWKSSAVIRTK